MVAQTVTITGTIGPAAALADVVITPVAAAFPTYTDQDGLLQATPASTIPPTISVVCDGSGIFSAPGVVASDNTSANAGSLPHPLTYSITVTSPATGQPDGLSPNQLLFSATGFIVNYSDGSTQDLGTILPAQAAPGFLVSLGTEIARAEGAEAAIEASFTGFATTVVTDFVPWSGGTTGSGSSSTPSPFTGPLLINGMILCFGPTLADCVNVFWSATGMLSIDQNLTVYGEVVNNGETVNGVINTAQISISELLFLNPAGAPVTVNTGDTINPRLAGLTSMLLAPTGNVTGMIMNGIGNADGQVANLINTTAFTITFDVAGTSNVADGILDVIAANRRAVFVWDATTSLWYRD